jgi:hypothetical protein
VAALADSIDFTRQSIIVVSLETGAMDLQNLAVLSSRALAALKSASYDRDWTVGSWLSSHPLAQRRLERMNLASHRLGTKFLSDGAISTEYEFPLTDAVLNLLRPATSTPRLLGKVACPCCGQPWPKDKEPAPEFVLVPYEDGAGFEYTGILIDAKGLDSRPALFPQVVTESGDEVIGPDFAKPELAAQSGLVGYFLDRTVALSSERIGANPLVVRAIGVSGTNSCDLVVSQADAARIHGSKSNLDLLGRCRVGFLMD